MGVDRPQGLELLDFDRLRQWMDEQRHPPGQIEDITQLTGGSQNIIVKFRKGDRWYVLRRPPANPRANGDETMRREARILAALSGTDVPHAPLIDVCLDSQVLGAAFYLMEPVEGFNPAVGLPPLHAGDPLVRRRMGFAVIDALAALSKVDFRAKGLADLGRLEQFLERQVGRWRRQLEGYSEFKGWPGPGQLPGIDHIGEWLRTHGPSHFVPGIMHGDYHLKNVMFRLDTPELAAIIDWELSTIGDPLIDLGWLVATWRGSNGAIEGTPIVIEPWTGFPEATELVERYCERTGRDVSAIQWYSVLACYKLALLLEGTFARACVGKAPMEIGERLHANAIRLLERALRWIG